MKLQKYIKEKGIKRKEAAAALGVTAATIHNLINGKKNPSIGLLIKMNKWSHGRITLQDFDREDHASGGRS